MLLNREQREQLKQLGSLSTIGLELGLSIALGYLGGRWLDAKLGTEPWLQWIGLALGLAAGARSLYRVVRRAQRMMEEEDESP
ncbi:MAG: AtpZ/AtpI family protein [Myxococcales bacterium]|nr:AtpZ/AtpI family protein [Myxococcales bacterium]MDH3845082.1 AtpZ/AtpI family protein [Myxococcales bacterium]